MTKLYREPRESIVISNIPGFVNIAIRLVNSVLHSLDEQGTFLGEFKLQKSCYHSCPYLFVVVVVVVACLFWGRRRRVKTTFELVPCSLLKDSEKNHSLAV